MHHSRPTRSLHPVRLVATIVTTLSLAPTMTALADDPAAPAADSTLRSEAVREMPTAEEILSRSIAYHDPDGVWGEGGFAIEISSTRPLAGARQTRVVIDNRAGRFHYVTDHRGRDLEATVVGDECTMIALDGETDPTPEELEELGLSCQTLRRTRDYHVYLYGLPMKLRDPGTRIDPEPTRTTFDDRDAWEIRVTYDPEVGSDTWYFYFHPETFALSGYRFYHDEAANDGEYVLLEREEAGGGLRLPKVRSWFTHADDRLLGTDVVRSIERNDGEG